jgi:hypothetical protein
MVHPVNSGSTEVSFYRDVSCRQIARNTFSGKTFAACFLVILPVRLSRVRFSQGTLLLFLGQIAGKTF